MQRKFVCARFVDITKPHTHARDSTRGWDLTKHTTRCCANAWSTHAHKRTKPMTRRRRDRKNRLTRRCGFDRAHRWLAILLWILELLLRAPLRLL
jgi:hypothetical protein